MTWIHLHSPWFGIVADSLTFIGGFILTRDAFLRLRELKKNRVDVQFRAAFPRLNLTDSEFKAAVASVRWALADFVLLFRGFLAQLLLRIAEAQ